MAVLGACSDAPVCHTSELACASVCIAPASDDANCGACGNVCAAGSTCQAGVCTVVTPACAAPMLQCGADCIDPQVTADHCGDCVTVCSATAECVAGACDGSLALIQTSLSTMPAARDLYALQDGTLDLTKLDAATFVTDRVVDHALLPDGRVVIVGALETEGVVELYVTSPRGGAPTKLSPALAAASNVFPGIVVSRDGSAILFRSDLETPGIAELYVVHVAAPGVITKVNGALAATGQVSRVFALSADGHRAAYVADEDTAGLEEAYTVDLTAAAPAAVKLNPAITQSVFDLALTADGTQVVYRAPDATSGAARLSEVDVATPGVANVITNADGGEGFVSDYRLSSDGAVVYTGSVNQLQQQLWRAPLAPPYAATLLVPFDSTNQRFVRELVVSADGAQIFFRQGQALFRVPVAAPRTPVKLSLATDSVQDLTTDFALAANEKTLAFRAGADGAEGGFAPTAGTTAPTAPHVIAPALYVLDLTSASAVPVLVSPPLAAGHQGISDGYVVLPDGRVLYRADEDTLDVIDAYLVSTAAAGAPRKVSPALGGAADADQVSRLTAYP